MNKLQFKNFVFENNPRRIELSWSGNLVSHVLPTRGSLTQHLGPRCRIVRCEGEVFAVTSDAAAAKLTALSNLCAGQAGGILYLPTGERFEASVSRFGYAAQGDGRVITYMLEFIERACATGEGGL